MPLDGKEHARAEHDGLEDNQDYRDPIHHLNISRLLLDTLYREEQFLKTLHEISIEGGLFYVKQTATNIGHKALGHNVLTEKFCC